MEPPTERLKSNRVSNRETKVQRGHQKRDRRAMGSPKERLKRNGISNREAEAQWGHQKRDQRAMESLKKRLKRNESVKFNKLPGDEIEAVMRHEILDLVHGFGDRVRLGEGGVVNELRTQAMLGESVVDCLTNNSEKGAKGLGGYQRLGLGSNARGKKQPELEQVTSDAYVAGL